MGERREGRRAHNRGNSMGKGEGDSGRGSAREGGIEWVREGRGGERTIEET